MKPVCSGRQMPGSVSMAVMRCCGQRPISLTKVPPLLTLQGCMGPLWRGQGRCGEACTEQHLRCCRVEISLQSWSAGLCRWEYPLEDTILPGSVNLVFGLAKADPWEVEHISLHRLSSTSHRSMSSHSPANEPQKVDFAALPLDKSGPHGNAWGRWGPNDQLGTLNFLTDDVVAKAVSECVKTGQRTSLK